jgi:hypothetical protein
MMGQRWVGGFVGEVGVVREEGLGEDEEMAEMRM